MEYDWMLAYEIIITVITLISFAIHNPLRFRQVNLIAAILWVIYGFMIDAMPVSITNGVISSLHIYHLFRHYMGVKRFIIE